MQRMKKEEKKKKADIIGTAYFSGLDCVGKRKLGFGMSCTANHVCLCRGVSRMEMQPG